MNTISRLRITLLALGLVVISLDVLRSGDTVSLLAAAMSLAAFVFSYWISAKLAKLIVLTICFATAVWYICQLAADISGLAWTGNVNLVGYVCALGSILAVEFIERNSWPALIVFVFMVTVSMITRCAGAVVISYISILFVVEHDDFKSLRFGAWFVLFTAILFVLITNGQLSYTQRLSSWIYILQSHRLPSIWIHAHNAFLQSYLHGWVSLLGLSLLIPLWISLLEGNNLSVMLVIFLLVSGSIDYIYWWPGIAALVIMATMATIKDIDQCSVSKSHQGFLSTSATA